MNTEAKATPHAAKEHETMNTVIETEEVLMWLVTSSFESCSVSKADVVLKMEVFCNDIVEVDSTSGGRVLFEEVYGELSLNYAQYMW